MRLFVLLILCTALASAQSTDLESAAEVNFSTKLEIIGDYGQYAPSVAALGVVLLKNDKQGFWQLAKGVSANFIITHTLKYAIDKPRPEGRTDGRAFPSGHTSSAFQGASFLQRRYGWKYGVPAYLVAGLVAYSRMEGFNERHDGWDVLGGIVVGIGSTYLFTTPYARDHFELNFTANQDSYLMGVVYKF